MDREYQQALANLNPQQKKAATQIDGPLLVLAGPGTGKTQLLSSRVGYILQATDALPQNILCLTFTEAGVEAMRQRLQMFLGQAAYDVSVSTYHAFGSNLLRRYPEYSDAQDAQAIDELGSDSLIREILAGASYDNPLKSADSYSADLRAFMSECKRALLTPSDARALALSNLSFIESSAPVINQVMDGFGRIDKKAFSRFEKLLAKLKQLPAKKPHFARSLKQTAMQELNLALSSSDQKNTKPLTAWKNKWLEKNSLGQFVLAGAEKNRKLLAAAEVYKTYQKQLKKRRLYDYDDMILRAINALENHPELKFTLAEQYQYILLDEFQDTNPAQFRIVELLTDDPVNEGRPNIMAVGDDDQAIYAFQGAEFTNMARFARLYRDTKVISLRENYRSTPEILDVAYNLGGQIQARLHERFEGVTKILKATGTKQDSKPGIAHFQFISDAAQYSWVADEVARLVKSGIELQEIALLAPKHRYLIPVLPYLAERGLPVRYEKRENILDKPLVVMLEKMSQLVLAMAQTDKEKLNELWPQVLSFDFWRLPTEFIWRSSWRAEKDGDWTKVLAGQPESAQITGFFMRLKDLLVVTTLEQQLDILSGVSGDDVKTFNLPMRSPFFEHYFGKQIAKDSAFVEHLGDLSVLRGRLRDWRRDDEKPFGLSDFVNFISLHRASGINILNTSPHYESPQAVNVMTAYQAKGREFKAVFVLAASDEVWGAASRSGGSNIALPPNLEFIRYQGASDDERLRLLYVAVTRAKTLLYLTSYTSTMDGKKMQPLKYLVAHAGLEPIAAKTKTQQLSSKDAQSYWHLRHLPPHQPKLSALLEPVLSRYQLSPTHLNQFTDVTSGGPQQFFLNSILRFPKGPNTSAQFGTATHNTLKWLHDAARLRKKAPTEEETMKIFAAQLRSQRLPAAEFELLLERGFKLFANFLERPVGGYNSLDRNEVNFRTEGVFVGKAHLSGKIDRLIFDKKSKTATVVDYKTGRAYDRWQSGVVKLHKYAQQLMVYKLLVEGSHSYVGWRVEKGTLDFVEAKPGTTAQLDLELDSKNLANLKRLIGAVWSHIMNLDFPDTSGYSQNLSGIKQFEADLIKSARE